MIKEQDSEAILDSIKIDLEDVKEKTSDGKDYKIDDSEIFLYTQYGDPLENAKDQRFLCNLKSKTFQYIGILNEKLQRNYLGKNFYSNGDKYLGTWKENIRNDNGIYFYKPTKLDNGKLSVELYTGSWSNGKKEGPGVYIWKEVEENSYGNEEPGTYPFEAFIGTMINDRYSNGLYITIDGLTQYAYFGKFDENGVKSDENGLYIQFSEDSEKIFNGTIKDDKLEDGIISFKKDSITKTIRLKNENGEVKLAIIPKEQNEIVNNNIEKVFNKLFDDNNFFELSTRLDKALFKLEKEIDGPEDFSNNENEDKYSKIMKWVTEYKELTSKVNHANNIKVESEKEYKQNINGSQKDLNTSQISQANTTVTNNEDHSIKQEHNVNTNSEIQKEETNSVNEEQNINEEENKNNETEKDITTGQNNKKKNKKK